MRVLVTGGREYGGSRTEAVRLFNALSRMHDEEGPLTIIEGGARGADTLAFYWAHIMGTNLSTFPANWDAFGKRAGPIRNEQMLVEGKPDLVLAFPGGSGTANMTLLAHRAGIEIVRG